MSYPNLGGYNASAMSYGNDQPGPYGGQQPGYNPGQPGGYGYGGSQSGGYPDQHPGGYPGQQPGPPGGVSPEVQQWFSAVDRDRSGKISAKELQAALVNGQGKNFSDQACNLMIGMFDVDESGMFDRDKSGTIDISEFQQLYTYINQWLSTFRTFDRDQSGHIDEAELAQAFQQMGFRFSPDFIKFLITKSDIQSHVKITVDQFILLCIQIQRFTENGSDVDYRCIEPPYDRSKRKRKHKSEAGSNNHLSNGLESENSKINSPDQREVGSGSECYEKLHDENERLRAEMNQIVNENVLLLKENKQLQEDNLNLQDKVRCFHEENERLRKEHKDALELSSWISSAKEIVQTLKKQPVIFNKPGKRPHMMPPLDTRMQRLPVSIPLESRSFPEHLRNSQWDDGEMPNSNGLFITPHIKMERVDEERQAEVGEESPYHTPLLNFDQVDFHPTGKECDVPTNRVMCPPDMTPLEPINDEVDRVGREQLLFPDPVEGVCELCPGSRIFVALTAMDNILSKKSHSSVARSCLEAIFKMPFLLSCSVQGNVAKGPYGKPDVQRPSLYKPAVECILRYARYHAEQNGWKVEENTTIKKQMNTRLSELRNIAKCKAASAEGGDPEHKGYSRYKNIVAALSALPIVAQPLTVEVAVESDAGSEAKDAPKGSDTEAFRTRDKEQQGTITIGFEDFLTVALSCSI